MWDFLKLFNLCCILSHIRGGRGNQRGTNWDLWLLYGNAHQVMARDPTISDPLTCRQPACLTDADTVSIVLAKHPSPSGSSWSSFPVALRAACAGFLQPST